MDSPDRIYAQLFNAVQCTRLFNDSKIFADAQPRRDSHAILESYRQQHDSPGFDLHAFVTANFTLPECEAPGCSYDKQCAPRQAIERLWDELTCSTDIQHKDSSLVSLPEPFVIPGGRFREIYYWDSYFTMLGLAASGRITLIEHMVNNFAFLIDKVGFVPNGNRTYYCTRSQLPLFALMVELLADYRQNQLIYARFLPQLEKEYQFWMSGEETLTCEGGAVRRLIHVDGAYLNRYWDDADTPRAESFAEDIELAATTDRNSADVYRNIRAACESGWDFSSRWFKDQQHMSSIDTVNVIPIDLNAVLYKMETVLARSNSLVGNARRATFYNKRARQRKALIQSLFFDEKNGFFVDLRLPDLQASPVLSLAGCMPLFFNIASAEQARRSAEKLKQDFLRPGGWVTTLNDSGQQWDAPNGWAPMQWIVYNGLQNYGFLSDAAEGGTLWMKNNLNVYAQSGRFWEKYNVETVGMTGDGGEYAVQEGFGWTNAVLLLLMNELGSK